jgi:uncharacterized protein (DUF433 family)
MDIEYLKRIEINPKVLCGKPVIRGTRISVELIIEIALMRSYTIMILQKMILKRL